MMDSMMPMHGMHTEEMPMDGMATNSSMPMMDDMHGSSMIFGLPVVVFLLIASAIVYAACAAFLWKQVRRESNELISALFAFFSYQSVSMLFMGLEMNTMNMLYNDIAALAVFIGSVFMLKFLYSSYSQSVRRNLFLLSVIIVLAVFYWFIQTPVREMMLMNFTLWYDIVVNGLFVGGAIIYTGLQVKENWIKTKTLGGGSGVVVCCVVSSATMLSGAMLTSSAFQFIAPVLIVSSLVIARKQQKAAIVKHV